MTGNFIIKRKEIKKCCLKFESIEMNLEKLRNRTISIRDNLSISGQGTALLKNQLKEECDNLKTQIQAAHSLKESLEEIERMYFLTESKITDNIEIFKIIGECIYDFWDDARDNLIDSWENWVEHSKERQENIIFRIKDRDTREGFEEAYRDRLQQLYYDVPAEYLVTRTLYDKYSRDLIVADFFSVDENGNATAYHSNGKLHINTNADLNNARGNGTTYYHEYGHFIVNEEGWVDGAKCKGPMKDFEDSLRKEITQYYESYEQQYRQEAAAEN